MCRQPTVKLTNAELIVLLITANKTYLLNETKAAEMLEVLKQKVLISEDPETHETHLTSQGLNLLDKVLDVLKQY